MDPRVERKYLAPAVRAMVRAMKNAPRKTSPNQIIDRHIPMVAAAALERHALGRRVAWQREASEDCGKCDGSGWIKHPQEEAVTRGIYKGKFWTMRPCKDCKLNHFDLFYMAGLERPELREQYGEELRAWGEFATIVLDKARKVMGIPEKKLNR